MTEPSPQKEKKPEEKQADTPLDKKQARVLKTIAVIKSAMFVVEGVAGFFAHSMSMKSDSLDMLEDAVGATTSVLVRKHSQRWQAGVALGKAAVMGIGGLGVLAGTAFLFLNPASLPATTIMAIVGGVAFIANTTCAALIYKHRHDNINMKSTWKCVRNDMFSNMGVLAAAGIGHFLISPIPDAVVGVVVAGLCIKGAVDITRDAIKILRLPENARKKKTAKSSSKPQPKMVVGFKKALRAVFNRKAAATQKAPVIEKAPAPAAPQEQPVREPAASKPDSKPDETPRLRRPAKTGPA